MQTTVATPASVQRSSASAVVSSDDSSQPAVRTIPSATSIATASSLPIASTNCAQRRRPERGGADDDARDPGRDERLRIGRRADAAAELHRHRRRRRDRRRGELERRPAVAGRRKRDDMDERRAGRGGAPHELERVAGVDLDPVEVAAEEPHGPAVEDVDRRKDCKAHVSTCYHGNTMASRATADPDIGRRRNTEELFGAIASLRNPEEVERFLRDLCTRSELDAMAHRWEVAKLPGEGLPYLEVARRAHASTTTVTRVAQWLRNGEGGYALALRRRSRSRS